MPNKPNILWIMTDQHRADCLGLMGNSHINTPNLDRLAESGIVFENAFCQSPVCMASRAVLFTGRYPAVMGVRGMGILPPLETTTPEVFQRNGYATGGFGKLHLTPELYTAEALKSDKPELDLRVYKEEAELGYIPDDEVKKNYGFQEHIGCDDALQGNFKDWIKEVKPELLEKERIKFPGTPAATFVSQYPSEFHQTTYIANKAIDYIEKQSTAKPWFTFCSFIAPHHPFEAPQDQIDKYDLESIPVDPETKAIDPQYIPEYVKDVIDETDNYTKEGMKRTIQHYYASISLIDDNVGRLIQCLKDRGEFDNTIIIFTADHGEFLGSRKLLRKPSLHFDELLRVPLLVKLPDSENSGTRYSDMIELTDVHPTLLGLSGLDINPGTQGTDWSEDLKNNSFKGRDDIFSELYDDPVDPEKCLIVKSLNGPYCACQTLRTREWKLNIYPTRGQQYGQLFDLINDPGEENNLYGNSEYSEVREKMLWQLTARLGKNVDPLPKVLSQW
ncbi:MAG: sulfatase family protein [Planctomycetota bacterium]|jgi:arylsulfatase A-like enzyme